VVVSRYEFAAGGLFFLFVVSALASRSWSEMWKNREVIACGSAVWFLSHMIGSQVNCLADLDLDRTYKKHLAQAVDLLGSRAIWLFLASESVLAFGLTIYMAGVTGRKALPALWIVGFVFTLAYSMEPVRFKRRGAMNPLTLLLVLYALPVTFGYFALVRVGDPATVVLLVGVGAQMASLILMNEVEDVPEDTGYGIRTPCVQYGALSVVRFALVLFVAGGGLALAGGTVLIGPRVTRLILLSIGIVGQGLIVSDLSRLARALYRTSQSSPPTADLVRRIGHRNPLHFCILAISVATISLLSLRP
jgi:4-hydroxybenzoate polyprenyltransferase